MSPLTLALTRMQEDTTELAAGTLADDLSHLGEFLPLYLTQKYGLPSLSDSHLFGLVDAVRVRVPRWYCN